MDDRTAGPEARRRAAGDNGSRRHDDTATRIAGGRKVIVAPDGGDAWAPAKPRPDETLVRAHRWKRLLEDGKYRSAGELAEAEGATRSFVNRLLRLTLLSPDIVEIILDGRQSKGLQLEELTRSLPSKWEEQQKHFPLHDACLRFSL